MCIILQIWFDSRGHYRVWDEIVYPFPNFSDVAGEVLEWITYTLLGVWLLICPGMKGNPWWKKKPQIFNNRLMNSFQLRRGDQLQSLSQGLDKKSIRTANWRALTYLTAHWTQLTYFKDYSVRWSWQYDLLWLCWELFSMALPRIHGHIWIIVMLWSWAVHWQNIIRTHFR